MITLLSDFGRKDAYIAVMKGVVAAIAPTQTMCDLTHEIAPQDILAARFNLTMAYPYFPLGTVHLAVVDPGVGSRRLAVAIQCSRGFLVGPDNGLFSGILQQDPALQVVALTNQAYWRVHTPSSTFQGRDIFAPVAAHLANGVPISELGDRIPPATLIQPNLLPFTLNHAPHPTSVICTGSLQYIDTFGNLITNIPQSALPVGPWQATLKSPTQTQHFLSIKTYSDLPVGTMGALVGSHGWVEIACNQGNAAERIQPSGPASDMGTAIGTVVEISRQKQVSEITQKS